MFASADKAPRLFYTLSEVVATAAAQTHATLTSFPEPLRLMSSSAKGQSFGHDGVCDLFALHGHQCRSFDRPVLVTLTQRFFLDLSRRIRQLFTWHQFYLSPCLLEPAFGHVSV
jgi:hypothetical protein